MKKIVLFATMALMPMLVSFDQTKMNLNSQETYVYICTGPNSKCYNRTSTCRGLGRCSGDIVKISKSSAIDKGRRACKICY